jgi:glycosyltransferase involved in cell wall biosynthesis
MSDKLRITFVTPTPGLGGGIRAVAMYADGLAKLGHKVTIVSTGPITLSLWTKLKIFVRERKWWRPAKIVSHFDALKNVRHVTLSNYRPIAARDVPDADIVIATWWETAEWVSRFPKSKGAQVYFVQHHEVVFDGQPIDRVKASYRLPMNKICCASWLKDLMATEYGDPAADYVPYGVDHATFTAPPRGKQARPTVGLMYARTGFKGTAVAAQAIEIARKTIPNLRVLLFGEHTINDEAPMPPDVEFELRPSQARIAEIYASCDAWLFPSKNEGFGLPILEALACRTPVIGTPTGVAPQVLSDGGGGLLVPMADPEAMANAIAVIAEMPEADWRRLSDAALATAGRFRWDLSALAFEGCLRNAVAAGRE